jgi:hypothetical protein
MEEILTPETVFTRYRALMMRFAQPLKTVYMINAEKFASLFQR